MIKKQKGNYVVTNKSGSKVLGKHKSREAALAQLAAVEAHKKRKKKA